MVLTFDCKVQRAWSSIFDWMRMARHATSTLAKIRFAPKARTFCFVRKVQQSARVNASGQKMNPRSFVLIAGLFAINCSLAGADKAAQSGLAVPMLPYAVEGTLVRGLLFRGMPN